MITDILKQAMELAAQQSETEQTIIAQAILEILDADAHWDALLSDPRTPQALEQLWAEAKEDVKAGRTETIGDSGFLS
jgi:cellobiose-specific phosphotransferase system component IIB